MGWNLCNFLKSRHELYASFCEHPFQIEGCRFLQIDLTRKTPVLEAIGSCRPEIIIHAAAISSPDVCEQQKERAWEVNVTGTQNILGAALLLGCRVVYVSTDMVFDGEQGNYAETNMPAPVNYYGLTKQEGEKLCLLSRADALVVRITLQYGRGNGVHSSSSDWLMSNLQSGKEVSLFTDQFRTMTWVLDTAQGLEIAALYGTAGEIYHLTGPERISRYEFGRLFASAFDFPHSLLKQSRTTTSSQSTSSAECSRSARTQGMVHGCRGASDAVGTTGRLTIPLLGADPRARGPLLASDHAGR